MRNLLWQIYISVPDISLPWVMCICSRRSPNPADAEFPLHSRTPQICLAGTPVFKHTHIYTRTHKPARTPARPHARPPARPPARPYRALGADRDMPHWQPAAACSPGRDRAG